MLFGQPKKMQHMTVQLNLETHSSVLNFRSVNFRCQWATEASLESGVKDAELYDDKNTSQANTITDPVKLEVKEVLS